MIDPAPLPSHLRLLSVCKIRMEVSVRRMSDPSLGKRRSSNPLVGLDGSAAQQLMIPLGEGELGLTLVDAHDQAIGLVDAAPDTVQLVLRAEAASYIPSLH